MNKYTLELESQGDNSSITVRENGIWQNIFFGTDLEELMQKAKDRVDQLKASESYEEIVYKDDERKITYKTRGLEKWLLLEIGDKLEVRSIVNYEGKEFSTFTESFNELKNFQLVDKTKTIIEL
jgi:viroplasmin and RNaseH domain-containing protein